MPEAPRVGILVGSESDRERMQEATALLDEAGVGYEFEVRSAHRTPGAVGEYARSARDRGLRVLICGAGLSAALPGAVAAQTDLPVIGVPLRSSLSILDGLDALLAIAPDAARRAGRHGRRRQRAQRRRARAPDPERLSPGLADDRAL